MSYAPTGGITMIVHSGAALLQKIRAAIAAIVPRVLRLLSRNVG